MTDDATISIRFTKEGRHCWPDAPAHRRYLASEHRHLFCVEVTTAVKHDDREIEFHDLRDDAIAAFSLNYLDERSGNFGTASCEMIARNMGESLARRHGREFTVSVWEDGECGARVTVGA